MAVSSRSLKNTRLILGKERKKPEQEVEDLSVLPNIDPNYYNLGTELPIEEIGNSEPLEQNIDQDLDASDTEEKAAKSQGPSGFGFVEDA